MAPSVDFPFAILAVFPVSFVVITTLKRFIEKRQHRLPLPPGPTPLPLLGNILAVDANEPWLTYTEWGKVYGDLIYTRIADQDALIVNSQNIAEDLMEKRSRIYSDRPYLATRVPFGWSFHLAFMGYNDEWRLNRRLMHQSFRLEAALKFRPMQITHAREMALNIIDDPEQHRSHFTTFAASVVMSSVYGYQSSTRNDPRIQAMGNPLDTGFHLLTPERALLLKTFPFLLKLPDWCWGSSIKRNAQRSTNIITKMVDVPFQSVQQQMADNPLLCQTSMVSENLRRIEKQDEASKLTFETALKNSAAAAIVGAYETTSASLMVFILAMVMYPDVQKRAQEEIDSVIGLDQLPTFEDRPSLPYMEALFREILRWHPIVPLGVQHATSGEDVYDGYFIPKGTIVMGNIWAMARDEKRYPDASRFMPERFLDINGKLTDDDPAQYVFGHGRRICPGRFSGDASLWASVVTMLATLNISPVKDDQGEAINFTPEFTTGLTRRPISVPCIMSARSPARSELMAAESERMKIA